jgi:hypothetical protein
VNGLERLARAVAETAPPADAIRMTRPEVVWRGALAFLGLGALGHLGLPQLAAARTSACKGLAGCLRNAEKAAEEAMDTCMSKQAPHGPFNEFATLGCALWTWRPARQRGSRSCLSKCPPPRRKSPPKGSPPTKQTLPPALPPNPYDDLAGMCANCVTAGGDCCFGGPKATGGLCACATRGVPCRVYNC